MPILVEVNGMDDAGRVGQEILIVRVGFQIPVETQILIRNIEYFNRVIVGKDDLKGYEQKSLLKYTRDLFDDERIDVSVYRIRRETQLQLMKVLYENFSKDLFKIRGDLIKALTSKNLDLIEAVLPRFKRFSTSTIYLESFVKSYGFQAVTKRLEHISKTLQDKRDLDRFIVVQIDGGYPFVFWWKQLLASAEGSLKKGSIGIFGITNGDECYPSISAAGVIGNTLIRFPERRHLFPMSEIDANQFYQSQEDFYEAHLDSLIFPRFQNRIIFIGRIDNEVERCIPYIMHREERTKNFESYHLNTDIESFLKRFGYGDSSSPENTIVVHGNLSTPMQMKNVKFCADRGYKIFHLSDFREKFINFFSEIEEELEFLPKQRKSILSAKLEKIRSSCLASFK